MELHSKNPVREEKRKGENFYDVTYNLHLISVVSASDLFIASMQSSQALRQIVLTNSQSERREESVFGNVLQNRSSDVMLIRNKGNQNIS